MARVPNFYSICHLHFSTCQHRLGDQLMSVKLLTKRLTVSPPPFHDINSITDVNGGFGETNKVKSIVDKEYN